MPTRQRSEQKNQQNKGNRLPERQRVAFDQTLTPQRRCIVRINCSQPTFTEAPWGGYKQSGIGRELGEWGLNNYLETKQITRYDSNQPWGWYLK